MAGVDIASPGRGTNEPPMNRTSFRTRFLQTGWRHVVGLAFIVYAVGPLLYVLSSSFSADGTMTGSTALFQSFSLTNYQKLFTDPQYPFLNWMINTVVIAAVSAVGTVLMGASAAYAFSRFRFRGRRSGLTSLLVVQMFPQLLAFVAIFLLLLAFQDVYPAIGLNTRLGLIMVYLGGALGMNTFLMYGFFNTIPRELDEAAMIDGASHARIFFTMILRLGAPVLAVVTLLSFIGTFSEVAIANVVLGSSLSPKNLTLALGLNGFISQQYSGRWGIFAAGSVLAAIPVVVLFQFLQRYIVSGLTAGAVKG